MQSILNSPIYVAIIEKNTIHEKKKGAEIKKEYRKCTIFHTFEENIEKIKL